MILDDFDQLKKISEQKFDNFLHSNALFLIFVFTFEIKTIVLCLSVQLQELLRYSIGVLCFNSLNSRVRNLILNKLYFTLIGV